MAGVIGPGASGYQVPYNWGHFYFYNGELGNDVFPVFTRDKQIKGKEKITSELWVPWEHFRKVLCKKGSPRHVYPRYKKNSILIVSVAMRNHKLFLVTVSPLLRRSIWLRMKITLACWLDYPWYCVTYWVVSSADILPYIKNSVY